MFGSMRWWKDDDDAAFTGIGEVSVGKWVNGAAIPCQQLVPPAPCLSAVRQNYDICEFSIDGGTTWITGTLNALDNYYCSVTIGGVLWDLLTQCGLVTTGTQGLQVQLHSNPSVQAKYQTSGNTTGYPATWSYSTVAGSPAGWPGTTVIVRTRCSGSLIYQTTLHGAGAAGATFTSPGAFRAGDSAVVFVVQYNGGSGYGPLTTPAILPSVTPFFSATSKQLFGYLIPNIASAISVTISGLANPDLSDFYYAIIRTPPGASVLSSNYKQAQPAATVLTTGNVTFTGDNATVLAVLSQYRLALGSAVIGPWGSVTGGFALEEQPSFAVYDGSTFYKKLSDALLAKSGTPSGTYGTGVTSPVSVAWDSAIVAVR